MATQPPLFETGPTRAASSPSPTTAQRVAPLPPVSAETSLASARSMFDEHLARVGKTENTRLAFASDLRLLAARLGASRAVGSIRRADLHDFLTWMSEHREQPCSAKTYARRVTTLKVFFAWLFECRATADDPAVALIHRRSKAPLPRVLADPEVASLLAAAGRIAEHPDAPDPRPLVLARLLIDTGLKKGELARLAITDIAMQSSPPSLLVRYESARWAEKQRRVTFSESTRRAIERYRARYRPSARLFECTPRNLEYVLADLVTAAGLPPGTSFETLRWTSALRGYRAGMDEEALRERLGLSPISWSATRITLELLAATAGPAIVVGEFFD